MRSIFKGRRIKKLYYFEKLSKSVFGVRELRKVVGTPTIMTIDIPEPILKIGDKFYDIRDNTSYSIIDVMRGSENTMIYFTDTVLSTITDTKSKKDAEINKARYNDEMNTMNKTDELNIYSEDKIKNSEQSWLNELVKYIKGVFDK